MKHIPPKKRQDSAQSTRAGWDAAFERASAGDHIATAPEISIIVPRTWAPGTPRGFGDRRIERLWLTDIAAVLNCYSDRARADEPWLTRYELDLEFYVWPADPAYRGQSQPHGTDLDNLIKNTVDWLTPARQGGLGIITDDKAVYRITAAKTIVINRESAGAWITINSCR